MKKKIIQSIFLYEPDGQELNEAINFCLSGIDKEDFIDIKFVDPIGIPPFVGAYILYKVMEK